MSTNPLSLFSRRRKGPSIIYFTVHKAASTYLKKVVETLASGKGIACVDYPVLYHQTDFLAFEELDYNPVGHAYGPFRWYMQLEDIDQYKLLLHLRDPRDTLVSQYFSFGQSHPIWNEFQAKRKERIEKMTLEEYVVDAAPQVRERYADYAEHMAGRPNVLFVKYEQMVDDFDGWLDAVAQHLDLADGNARAFRRIKRKRVEKVEKEDPRKHVRQITPGDHVRKLDTRTIDELNKIFGDVLRAFDHPLQAVDPLAEHV